MAIWQYVFNLVERKSLEDLFSAKQFIEGKSFSEEPFWSYSYRSKSFFAEFDLILKKNRSWSDEIDLYGMQDGHCLEVSFNDQGYITSVSCRIDFGNPYESILEEFVSFCIIKNLAIIDALDLKVLPPDHKLIYNTIKSSKQWTRYHDHKGKFGGGNRDNI